ncbi:hypothetical protein DSECCO2_213350 [anaerobic digester metagenome]
MTSRYLLGSKSQVYWGTEGTPYTVADPLTTPFGLIQGDIDWPQANPKTPFPASGHRRAPYVHSKDEYDLAFSIAYQILGKAQPFACCVGPRTAADGTGYTGYDWTDEDDTSDILGTISIRRDQKDAILQETFIGCKADLSLAARAGEPVVASLNVVAAQRDPVTTGTPVYPTLTIPSVQPYRFWMLGAVALTGGLAATIATVNEFNLTWANGLAARHHGGGRNAYSVVEEEVAGRYDMKLGITVTDESLYAAALEDTTGVDVMIPLIRDGAASLATSTDAMAIYLNDCDILDAPIPTKEAGDVQGEIVLAPKSTKIHIREPTT